MPDSLIPPVVATFAAQYSEFIAGTEAVVAGLGDVQATAVRTSESTAGSFGAMGAEAERAAAKVDTSAATMVTSMDRLSIATAGDAAKWDVEMATMAASMDKMSANVAAAAGRAEAANAKLATSMTEQAVSTQTRMGEAAGALGSFGAKLGVVAGGAAIATTMMAATFDQKMMLIRTNAHDSTDSIDAMSKSVLQMAGDVGQTPDKLAEGLYHITSTGLRGAEALDVLRNSAKDATIGLADLDTVTYAMSGVMSVGMVDVKNAADGVALLNTIVGQGDMHMQDLANAIGTGVLPVFKNAGLGAIDFGAALSTLTDNSTPAEVAANHLKTSIMLLQNQSGPAKKALLDLGIQQGELSSEISKPGGLMVAIMDLKTHMDDYTKTSGGVKMSQAEIATAVKNMAAELTKEGTSTQEQTDLLNAYRDSLGNMGSAGVQAAADLSKAFGGARSAMTIETLVQESGKLQSKYAEMGDAASRQAQAQRDWNDTQAQFKTKLQDAKASAEALGISVGNLLIPFVTKAMDIFHNFTSFLQDHEGVAKALAIVIGGALVVAFISLTAATVAWAIAIQATPMGWIMDGIAALIAIVAVIVSNWDAISGFFKGLWDDVTGFFTGAGRAIGKVVGDIVGFVTGLPGKIGQALSNFGTFLARIAADAWHAFTHAIEVAAQATLNFFKNLPYEIGYALGTLIGLLIKVAVDTAEAFWHACVTGFHAVLQFFMDLPGNILSFFKDIGHWLSTSGLDLLTGLWNGIVTGAKAVWQWFKDLPGNIWGLVKDAWHWLLSTGGDIIHGIGQGIADAAVAIWRWFGDLPGNIGRAIGDASQWLVHVGRDILVGLWNGIAGLWNWLWKQVSDFFSGLVDGIKHILGISSPSKVTAEMGGFLMQGLADGVADNVHLAVGAAQKAAGAVLNGFGGSGSLGINATGSLAVSTSGSAGGGGGTTIVNVYPQNLIGTKIELRDQIMQLFQQRGIRNGSASTFPNFRLG